MNVLQLAETKKRAAQRCRNTEPEKALALIGEVIDALEAEWSSLSDPVRRGERGRMLAEALADAYGTKGGILRTARNYEESFKAYAAGNEFERDERYRFANSYNLTQRLVARILARPALLTSSAWEDGGVVYPEDFEKAEQEVSRQLSGPRANDAWAMADRALLLLLLGRPDDEAAWLQIERAAPPAYVFTSTLKVVEDLRREIREHLAQSTSPHVAWVLARLDAVAEFLDLSSRA